MIIRWVSSLTSDVSNCAKGVSASSCLCKQMREIKIPIYFGKYFLRNASANKKRNGGSDSNIGKIFWSADVWLVLRIPNIALTRPPVTPELLLTMKVGLSREMMRD